MTRARLLAKFIQYIETDGQITSDGIDGGITFNSVVTTFATLPASGTTGQIIYVTGTSKYYFWDGADWNEITTV